MEVIEEREQQLIAASTNKDRTRRKIQFAKNLILFGRISIPEMCTKPNPPFHYKLAEYLTDVGRQLINLVAPRGHAKSSIVACVFVLWHIFLEDIWRFIIGDVRVFKQKPKLVVLVSKTQGEAIRRLDTIKGVLGDEDGKHSSTFRQIFGNWGHGTHKTWTRTEVVLKDGTTLLAIGAGQQARGLKKGHQRPTLILADDPEDEENTKTSERMAQNMGWLLQAIIPSLDADTGRCVVIGTPQNHQCMVVQLHESVGWTSAWFGNDLATGKSTWDGENYDKDQLLWPELIGKEKLQGKMDMARSLGRLSSYYREYESKVVGDEDQLFKPEYFRDYQGELKDDLMGNPYVYITHRTGSDGKLEKLDEPESIAVNLFMGVDPASSTNNRADYTVIMVIGVDAKGHIYVIHYTRKRMPPAEVLRAVERVWTSFKFTRGQVETIQAQEYIVSMLREKGIFLLSRKPRQGKEERLVRLEPKFAQGQVWTLATHTELKKECLDFPRGKHDDALDAFDIALDCSYKPTGDAVLTDEQKTARATRKKFDPMLA